jgi:phosphoribosylformylglycinamidine cyclo-ligase
VEKDKKLPSLSRMAEGDPLYALPSSGVHSNGLSLARKAVPEDDTETWKALLTPTRIYVRELIKLAASGTIAAAAHITGGGLEGNLTRVLAPGLLPRIRWDWKVPPVFEKIAAGGRVPQNEMRLVFNMGVGIALVVPKKEEAAFLALTKKENMETFPLGELFRG